MPWNAPLPPSLSFNAHLRSSGAPVLLLSFSRVDSTICPLLPLLYSTLPHFSPSFYLPLFPPPTPPTKLRINSSGRFGTPAKFSNRFADHSLYQIFANSFSIWGNLWESWPSFPTVPFHAFFFSFRQNVNRADYYYYYYIFIVWWRAYLFFSSSSEEREVKNEIFVGNILVEEIFVQLEVGGEFRCEANVIFVE